MRAEFASFANGTGGAPAEGFRLKASGALAGGRAAGAPFRRQLRSLVDALPKHWSGPAGPGPATESHLDRRGATTCSCASSPRRRASGPWSAPAEREAVLGARRARRRAALRARAAQRSRGGERGGGPGERGVRRRAGGAPRSRGRRGRRDAGARRGGAGRAGGGGVLQPPRRACPPRCSPRWRTGSGGTRSVAAADRGASLRQRAEALDALSRALLGALGAAAEFRAHRAALYPPGGRGHRAAAPLELGR